MPGTTTQFKLGLFSILAVVGLLAAAIGLGLHTTRRETVRYETYFDESAQGLEPGAPVKYRGVRIGRVSEISIAPDRRQVRVVMSIDEDAARRLQLSRPPPELRTQLAIQGVTGVKFIDMDFVDPAVMPPPKLTFRPGPHYIPSRPSFFKGIETRIGSALAELPKLVDSAKIGFDKLGATLDEIREQELGTRAARTLDKLDRAADHLDHWAGDLRRAQLPERAARTLGRVDEVADEMDRTLDQLSGAGELIASAKRATDTFGEIGRTMREVSGDLARTIRDLGDAARSVREFMDALEREPDMLVKGRARAR